MGDYGFRISVDGKDVKTCDDLDTVVNSKYSNLKGSLSGIGSVSVPNTTLTTVTIAHNLGYIPFATVLSDRVDTGEFNQSPEEILFFSLDYWLIKHRCDDTNLYIEIFKDDSNRTITVPYKYYIYLDKGNI
jgi:hypothetical protein